MNGYYPTHNAPAPPPPPSLYRLQCPNCGTCGCNDLLGSKGANARGWGIDVGLGWIGSIVASQANTVNNTIEIMRFKCQNCKSKFESTPLYAGQDEMLTEPSRIYITRRSSVFDMTMVQSVYLNGFKVAVISNGQTIEIWTTIRYNSVFITSQHGEGINEFKIEALPAGQTHVEYTPISLRGENESNHQPPNY